VGSKCRDSLISDEVADEMNLLMVIGSIVVSHIILPCIFLIWLWRGKEYSKLAWLSKLLVVVFYCSYIFLVGRWDWLSYYLRFVLIVLLFLSVFKSYVEVKFLAFYPTKSFKPYLSLCVNFLVLIVFAFFNILALQGYFFADNSVQLSFPLHNGTYYVGHGGNNPVINYHNTSRAQKYALDVVKLNFFGTRATGIYPKELTKYEIFGDTLYSPCNGTVKTVQDRLPDLIPPEMDQKNLAGNYILIKCKNAEVLIAHILNGSITVKIGEIVKIDQSIAKVGNSGNTNEPHLHIHALKINSGTSILNGKGIPIVFEGRFLVRNSLID
jgi:Peptidase family M23